MEEIEKIEKAIKTQLTVLRSEIEANEKMFHEMIKAYDGAIYPIDLLAIAVLHRSQALIEGFCKMVEDRNFDCAAPLIRLKLDNCLRFYASFIVKDPHGFAMDVVGGKHIRKLKDRDGNNMTDAHLVEKLSGEKSEYSFIKQLYEDTSGFIHLSDRDIKKSFGSDVKEERKITFPLNVKNLKLPETIFLQAIDAFKSATKILSIYIEGWIYTKNNPEEIAALAKKLGKN
jgi:hypothetical protein